VGKDVAGVTKGAAEAAVEAAGEISKDALDAVKKSLSTAASVPRDVVESAIKGSEGKTKT
jgi:hypothetical protein